MITIIPQNEISPELLTDESRLTGRADSLSFPENKGELIDIVSRLAKSATPFTVQGARTGITGGAVPDGGHILNLSRMNRVTSLRRDAASGDFLVTLEPGLTLSDFQERIRHKELGIELPDNDSQQALRAWREAGPFFFPPDPTETTATLGGMAACNASGARSFRHGPMRRWVQALRIVLASGGTARLTRGDARARGREFSLTLDSGSVVAGRLPGYVFRPVKNAAGYFVRDDLDLVDLFIGQEGTLAVIASLTVRLIPQPPHTLGVLFFFKAEATALEFVVRLRDLPGTPPSAIEYFDKAALEITAELKNEALRRPDPGHDAAVYVEADGDGEDGLFARFAEYESLIASLGESPEANWAGAERTERESLRLFRHAVPEAVNARIAAYKREAPDITKLGTDFAVGDGELIALVGLYRRKLKAAGLAAVMFGHIGSNHLHVNVLPRDRREYEAGKKAFAEIAAEVVRLGGTVSAEHGIGKLKRDYLELMYGASGIEEMKGLKRTFDPGFLLNRGNLFTLP